MAAEPKSPAAGFSWGWGGGGAASCCCRKSGYSIVSRPPGSTCALGMEAGLRVTLSSSGQRGEVTEWAVLNDSWFDGQHGSERGPGGVGGIRQGSGEG